HARAHYLLAKAMFAANDSKRAATEFQTAIDLDPMPWRPPGRLNELIHEETQRRGAALCDVRQTFRDASPGGCIGWELMDDHVHPALSGQALLARAIVRSMCTLRGPLAVDRAAYDALPADETYARRLGDNMYDRYAVAHT